VIKVDYMALLLGGRGRVLRPWKPVATHELRALISCAGRLILPARAADVEQLVYLDRRASKNLSAFMMDRKNARQGDFEAVDGTSVHIAVRRWMPPPPNGIVDGSVRRFGRAGKG
jgi:hypothetical protein